MKFGKKTKNVPDPERGGRVGSKYLPIFDKIDALDPGEFLPITFEDNAPCHKLYQALHQRHYHVKRRGLTLYVGRQKED